MFCIAVIIIGIQLYRSLHNMRNFVHVNLCISLGIAQIIFVSGINQYGTDRVPIRCKVVAVLLHYFFLVSFMWMLMEGVILYVLLVKVFIKKKIQYLLIFFFASYGVPLIYMGILTLPLGFALPASMQPNYGYSSA